MKYFDNRLFIAAHYSIGNSLLKAYITPGRENIVPYGIALVGIVANQNIGAPAKVITLQAKITIGSFQFVKLKKGGEIIAEYFLLAGKPIEIILADDDESQWAIETSIAGATIEITGAAAGDFSFDSRLVCQ